MNSSERNGSEAPVNDSVNASPLGGFMGWVGPKLGDAFLSFNYFVHFGFFNDPTSAEESIKRYLDLRVRRSPLIFVLHDSPRKAFLLLSNEYCELYGFISFQLRIRLD